MEYKRILIFLLRLYAMENPFELLISKWEAQNVLDEVTSMTSP